MLNCKELNLAFLRSEQKVSKGLIKKKMVVRNAYYGKVPDGSSFPLGSGTRIKGQKLARIGVPDCQQWTPVEDGLCATNACDDEYEIVSNGNSEFFFSLVKFGLRTDWICLDALALRELPAEEIAHLEDGLRGASRYTHEEFRRSRYLLMGKNKFVTILPEASTTGLPTAETLVSNDGAEQILNGYVFETLPNGEMDQCHVRVAVTVAGVTEGLPSGRGVNRIGTLTLDNLDTAAINLEYEDEMYLGDTGLFDVLLPSGRMPNQLTLLEDDKMGNPNSYGGNVMELRQTYGTEKVLRNYSLRRDIHAMRFYPDVTFNAALAASEGYAYDAQDPATWARFVRVFPYIQVKANVSGVESVVNPNYIKAPFGISTILTPRVMEVMSFPDVSGFGSAKKAESVSFEGVARWKNPDWECNMNRNKGFWLMNFRMAAKQNRPEEGYSWFHRIDNRVTFGGVNAAVNAAVTFDAVTPYCYEGVGGVDANDPGTGGNAVIEGN